MAGRIRDVYGRLVMNMIQGIFRLLLWVAALYIVLYGGLFGIGMLFINPSLGLLILFVVYVVGKNTKF